MGCFPKKNQVLPLDTENDQPPRAIRHKAKKRKSKKGKTLWNVFTKFITGLLCVSSSTVPFKNSVVPVSMYENAADSDSDSSDEEQETTMQETTAAAQPPPKKRGFQEVQLTMAPGQAEVGQEKGTEGETEQGTKANDKGETEDTAVAPLPAAKLTVPITELPKPTECSTPQETRTNKEIIQEFRDSGLVADVIGGNVKPSGVSYEIRLNSVRVRPKTAKGFRVPKPPRRLESLGVKPAEDGEEKEKLADKIKEKQKKAALKRQEMKESQLQKRKEKDDKQQKALQYVAEANDQKKRDTAAKIASKAERVKSARLSHIQERQRKIQEKSQQHQKAVEFVTAANEQKKKDAAETIASKAERVKSARLCSQQKRLAKTEAERRHRDRVRRRCDFQKSPDIEYDKISTYNGSSTCSSRNSIVGSDDGSPLYYKTVDNLEPIKSDESQDDFFDRPIGKGEDN